MSEPISKTQIEANIARLAAAAGSGELSVDIQTVDGGGQTLRFHSMDSLLKALAFWRRELRHINARASGRKSRSYATARFHN